MSQSYSSCLSVNRIRLMVHLGCEKEERIIAQPVEIDIRIYFPELPPATHEAQQDFICYDKMTTAIAEFCTGREFKLIEYLCLRIYDLVRSKVKQPAKIWLRLRKCNIPVEQVQEGASFAYTDLPPGAWVVPS